MRSRFCGVWLCGPSIEARCSMRLSTPPRLVARVKIFVRPATDGTHLVIGGYADGGAGHIAGAINVPIESLPRFLKKLPKEQDVVAYCRGPYCLLAFEAVDKLRKKGFRARRLEDGFPEWQAERMPVEK